MTFIQPINNLALNSVRLPILITVMLTLLSCVNPDIKITSDDMDMSLVAGEWNGEFSSQASGNSGTISFNLTKGQNTANGQVFIKGNLGPISLKQPLVTKYSRALPIEFVHIGNNMIEGKVTPFKDFKRNVTIHTRFKGKINGDMMVGTYVSTIEETKKSYTGNWKVKRRK